jgi:hypothetical protein
LYAVCWHPSTRCFVYCLQVLHRPPITAIYAENRAHNFIVNAHVWTKSQFNAPQSVARSVIARLGGFLRLIMPQRRHFTCLPAFLDPLFLRSILEGACVLTLTNLGEEYWITFPTYYAHNLLIGSLRMEVCDGTCFTPFILLPSDYDCTLSCVSRLYSMSQIGDKARVVCVKTGLHVDIDFHQMGTFSSSTVQARFPCEIKRFVFYRL